MEILDWYIGFILLGFLLSIPHFFLLDKFKNVHLLTFLILLLATLLEFYGTYTAKSKINNTSVYNVFFVYGETLLILSLFYTIFNSKKEKNTIKIASFLFLFWGIFYTILFENLNTFHSISFSIGSFLIILCCSYFFISTFYKDWFIYEKLILNPLFWITTFIFLFYTTTFLYFSSIALIIDLDSSLVLILDYLKWGMAVLMYLGMGLAFYLPFITKNTPKA
jgi:hypothetical protein